MSFKFTFRSLNQSLITGDDHVKSLEITHKRWTKKKKNEQDGKRKLQL